MKKFLFSVCFLPFLSNIAQAQVTMTTSPSQTVVAQPNPIDEKADNFDKKLRFGIRGNLQPTWYKSDNTSSEGAGAYFGAGFGLMMEFKLSNIIHFSTGIGGDFEGGKIKYRFDSTFQAREVINNENELVEYKDGMSRGDYDLKEGNTIFVMKERQYRTTMVTIPLLLKMMTNEYSGFRYFGIFGAEVGIRAGAKANETYYSGLKAVNTGSSIVQTSVAEADLKKEDILVGKDASLFPGRFGMNLGLGFEYRIAGSTSLMFSANYFQSFTNLMQKKSDYMTKDAVGSNTFTPFNQSYLMRAVRINVGILF